MARVVIETPGEDIIVGGSDVTVNGTTSAGETITIVSGNVTLDASFTQGGDSIVLSGEASDYTATRSGSRIILTNGTTTVSIPLSPNANAVAFEGGADVRTLAIVDGDVMLGDQEIAATGTTEIEADEGSDILDALADLQDAETALADFLEEAEATPEEIRDAEADAEADLAADRASEGSDAFLDAEVEGAEARYEAAQSDVADVDGLEDALEDLADAEAAVDAALEGEIEAEADYAGAEAEYEVLNGTTVTNTLTIDADGDWTGTVSDTGGTLIVVEDGEVVLADGVTEANSPGVTALLEAAVAQEEAEYATSQAFLAADAAADEVDLLDQVASANDERAAVATLAGLVEDYRDAFEAYDEDDSEDNAEALEDAYAALAASDVRFDAYADADAIEAAEAAIEADIAAETTERYDELVAAEASNPLVTNLENRAAELADAEDAVAAREELIEAVEDAQALVADLEALEDDVAAAQDAIEDLGYEAPVTLDGGSESGTNGNDVFIFAGDDGEIEEFGEDGDDILFVGEGYTLVALDDEEVGDDEVGAFDELEIFIQQDGDDTILYIENTTFAGNEADGSWSGNTIVLEDVDAESVVLNADGTITIDAGTEAAAGWQALAADSSFA